MNSTLALLFAAALSLVACAAPVEGDESRVDDVVRGTRDRGRHPAVVALRIDDGTLCSGSLVGRRAVLTARHCVSVTTATVRCGRAQRHVLRDRSPRSIAVVTDDDARHGAEVARAQRVLTFDELNLCGSDVAVLVLDRDVPSIVPLALDRAGPRGGDAVTVVGYGRRGDSARAGVGERFQRAGVRVLDVSEREFVATEGTCSGDSGGPAIDARTGRIVGVTSRGGDRCTGDVRAVFTRAFVALPLIEAAR